MGSRLKRFRNDLLRAKHIGLDTMCFAYQLADDPTYSPLTHQCFSLLETNKITAATSMITVAELFVLPEKHADSVLISEYEKLLRNFPNLTIVMVDWAISRIAASLRAHYPAIHLPDAIQLAAALLHKCTIFITNDAKLRQVKEIQVKVLKDYL